MIASNNVHFVSFICCFILINIVGGTRLDYSSVVVVMLCCSMLDINDVVLHCTVLYRIASHRIVLFCTWVGITDLRMCE